jgi:hypothetical protein
VSSPRTVLPADGDMQNMMIAIGCLMNRLGLQNTEITYAEAQALYNKQLGTMANNGKLYLELVDKDV